MLSLAENDIDFFSRRAPEEARFAAAATSAGAAAAHRRMAAIYAARLREEQMSAEGLADLLSDLDHRELDADGAAGDWAGDSSGDWAEDAGARARL